MAVDFIQNRNAAVDFEGNALVEIACLSTDEKPTGAFLSGSTCTEVDTGKVFFYDREGEDWVEQFSLQS